MSLVQYGRRVLYSKIRGGNEGGREKMREGGTYPCLLTSTSHQPVKISCRLKSDWPCLTKTTGVGGRREGDEGEEEAGEEEKEEKEGEEEENKAVL